MKRNAREATDRFFAEKLPAALEGIWKLAEGAEDEKVKLAALKQVKDHFQPKTTVPGGIGGATFQILNYIPLPKPQAQMVDVGPALVPLPQKLLPIKDARVVEPETSARTKYSDREPPDPQKVPN